MNKGETLAETEHRLMVAGRRGLEGGVPMVKGEKYRKVGTEESWGCRMCSRWNVIDNFAVTMYSARCVLEISGGHFVTDMTVQPLCWTPETNTK